MHPCVTSTDREGHLNAGKLLDNHKIGNKQIIQVHC